MARSDSAGVHRRKNFARRGPDYRWNSAGVVLRESYEAYIPLRRVFRVEAAMNILHVGSCEVGEMRNSTDAVGYLCSRTASTQCSDCGSELCESHAETLADAAPWASGMELE